jgi:hypothetical protein
MAVCASVWSREYPTGLSDVALASGLSEESSSVTPVYPQLYHPLLSSSSRRSREIGPSHIILVLDFHGLFGEHPQIHPVILFCF